MFQDAQNQYSTAQAVTAAADSTNSIDHQIARDLGTGRDIYIVVVCTVAMTDSGSDSTVDVTIQTSADNSSFTKAQTIGTFAAVSAAGTGLFAKLQPGVINARYSNVHYAINNGNLTTGSFTAFLTTDIQQYVSYKKGYTIS